MPGCYGGAAAALVGRCRQTAAVLHSAWHKKRVFANVREAAIDAGEANCLSSCAPSQDPPLP